MIVVRYHQFLHIFASLLRNRFAAEGKKYQLMADEEGTKAMEEFTEAEKLKADMEESEYLAQSEKDEAEKDEALAALDEDVAAEYAANSAQDEAIGTEEEASSITAQTQAEELLGSSTGEELSANSIRIEAESKEAEAEQVTKTSLAHGTHAFGFAFQSLMTAGLVIYVVVMRFLFHFAVPALKRSFTSESQFTTLDFGEQLLLLAMHFTVFLGAITLLVDRLHFDDDAITRLKALVLLASAAGLIESTGIHSLTEACCGYMNGNDAITTTISIAVSFASNLVYLVPVLLMECLILVVVFGPNVFDQIHDTLLGNRVLLWSALLLMFSMRIFKFKRISVAKPDQAKHFSELENGVEEGHFCGDERESLRALNTNEMDQEYGSMEEISLLNSLMSSEVNTRSESFREKKSTGCYQKCYQKCCQYWKSLQVPADLFVCSLMVMQIVGGAPLLKVLEPVSKSFFGIAASFYLPILLVVSIGFVFCVHFMFVR